jgi:hypothetical protein
MLRVSVASPTRLWRQDLPDRRSPFAPLALLELALFGLIVQPARELAASQSKENQGKMLGFPWIPLAESGLFNGLQRKNRKNPPPAELACQVACNRVSETWPSPSLTGRLTTEFASAEIYTLKFWICQQNRPPDFQDASQR